MSTILSAIIIVVALVFALMQSGIMDASITFRLVVPLTSPNWFTTDNSSESGPILQVPEICWPVVAFLSIQSSSSSSFDRSISFG